MTPREKLIEMVADKLANNGLHGMPIEDCITSVEQIIDMLKLEVVDTEGERYGDKPYGYTIINIDNL